MTVLNTHIIVLHSIEDVIALLEKRSTKYSDRPIMALVELLGMEFVTPAIPYGDRWRRHRRVFQESVRKELLPLYGHIFTEKVHLFLGELFRDPQSFSQHCKWLAGAVTLSMGFAYNVPPGRKRDPMVYAAEYSSRVVSELSAPGRTLINALPVLKYIPPWFPGAYTQRLAASAKKTLIQHQTGLFEHVRRNMATGASNDCIAARLLRSRTEGHVGGYDDDDIKHAIGTMYIGGVTTTRSTMTTFILALALHQEVQRKAQTEIDQVVGSNRLPTSDDRPSLPYVEALFREALRWRTVFPIGVAHMTSKDDLYKGFYIPKGTIVFANIWAINKDPAKYPDPERLIPERQFNTDGTLNDDTASYGFGFGRRICPGRHIADSLLWLTFACILATFDICKAKDDNGNEINIDPYAYADSMITYPLPFKCSITPRSRETEDLIRIAATSKT
ncbi:Cytochrome P450 [Amanita muscaria]